MTPKDIKWVPKNSTKDQEVLVTGYLLFKILSATRSHIMAVSHYTQPADMILLSYSAIKQDLSWNNISLGIGNVVLHIFLFISRSIHRTDCMNMWRCAGLNRKLSLESVVMLPVFSKVTAEKSMKQNGSHDNLFSVFSNKHHYNFYNKFMWKNVHPVYGAGIRTHDRPSEHEFPPIATKPGLLPYQTFNVTFNTSTQGADVPHMALLTLITGTKTKYTIIFW